MIVVDPYGQVFDITEKSIVGTYDPASWGEFGIRRTGRLRHLRTTRGPGRRYRRARRAPRRRARRRRVCTCRWVRY